MVKKSTKWVVVSAGLVIIALSVRSARLYLENKKYERVSPRIGELTEAVYGLGKVKARNRFELKLGVTSTVRRLRVQEGSEVRQGQPLIEFEDHVVAKAPFDGTVTYIAVNENETAPPQIIILRLEDLSDRYIELSIEQEAALRIKKGQTARIAFETLRGSVSKGTVISIFPRGDEFIAWVGIEDLEKSVLPGMTADVSIEIGKMKGTLVPLRALRNGILNVVREGKLQKQKVEVGLVDGLSAEIKGNVLKPSDEVLVPKEN